MNIISVNNVSVRYNSVEVLSDMSFNIAAGDYLGIVGPNGSGKTTLIKAMFGLIGLTKGTVTIFGKDVSRISRLAQNRLSAAKTFFLQRPFSGNGKGNSCAWTFIAKEISKASEQRG